MAHLHGKEVFDERGSSLMEKRYLMGEVVGERVCWRESVREGGSGRK